MSEQEEKPAFPIKGTHCGEVEWHMGLTKREYFAAAALTGILAAPIGKFPRINNTELGGMPSGDQHTASRAAVLFADALLRELKDRPNDGGGEK